MMLDYHSGDKGLIAVGSIDFYNRIQNEKSINIIFVGCEDLKRITAWLDIQKKFGCHHIIISCMNRSKNVKFAHTLQFALSNTQTCVTRVGDAFSMLTVQV